MQWSAAAISLIVNQLRYRHDLTWDLRLLRLLLQHATWKTTQTLHLKLLSGICPRLNRHASLSGYRLLARFHLT